MKNKISLCLASVALISLAAHAADPAVAPGKSSFPLQLQTRVPFAPTAFPSVGGEYLVYELHLTNFSGDPMSLRRIDVLNGDDEQAKPIASFEGQQLDRILQRVGAPQPGGSSAGQLAAGATAVAFMWIRIDSGMPVPAHLAHRIVTADNAVEGTVISTHATPLQTLSPPVHGTGWMASDAPSNDLDNHHRRGILAIDGQVVDSRRYAIDWFLHKDGNFISGDAHDLHSYYDYGQPVYAVADAVVVKAKDGQPDNVPGPVATFHPAVPITMDTVGGNIITLDLGNGHYAWYFHLQPGSIQVKTGDHVRRGQPLARIGCSGDPPVPHLHFEVTTSTKLVGGEGVPYVIDHYRLWTDDKTWQTRAREMPLNHMLVDFGGEKTK